MSILEEAKKSEHREAVLRKEVAILSEMLISSISEATVLSGNEEPKIRDIRENIATAVSSRMSVGKHELIEI